MAAERPVPPGWTSRPQLYPVGGAPGGDAAILRDTLQRIADKVIGLDSASRVPGVAAAYEAFCFPYDRPAFAAAASDSMSGCARVGINVCDCLGASSPGADNAYEGRIGLAVSDVVALGKSLGAWVDSTIVGAEFPMGPFVALVGNNGPEGAEHVFVGLDGVDEDGDVHAFEGGQPSLFGAGQRIERAVYEFQRRDEGRIWCRRTAPNANAWRRLRGFIDLEACLFTQRATLPEDDGPEAALLCGRELPDQPADEDEPDQAGEKEDLDGASGSVRHGGGEGEGAKC